MPSISRRDFIKVAGLGIGGALLAPATASAATPTGDDPNNYIGMLYDATMCVGCNACTNACRQWNSTTAEPGGEGGIYDAPRELSGDTWTLIQLYREEENYSFVKRQCMHCVDPACVSGCPVQALQKSSTGPVTYDAGRCIGCRYCMYTCPFDVPRFEWEEVIPKVQKCTLCNDRLEKGLGTACAEICPTGALVWGRRGDLIAEAESRLAAEPDRYVGKVYGKDDAGGTSVMYLSATPFENLGLPSLGNEPIPALSERSANIFLPTILIGGPLLLASIRAISKREGWA
ncbi:MAG: hydrogenase 2 operon protein HybA [Chloroflexi bacterium]|nr:hydrogenase 2 operon protein HybA [Chloroflexota bacterium]